MGKNKLLAIGYSDLHKHNFSDFSKAPYDRFKVQLQVEKYLVELAYKHKVPLLFAGDMFHDPDSLKSKILTKSLVHYKNTFEEMGVPLVAISGNHDIPEKNLRDRISQSYLWGYEKVFETFNLLDKGKVFNNGSICVHGIPYLHDEVYWFERVKKANDKVKGINAYKILLVHKTLPNCVTPLGFKEEVSNLFPRKLDTLWDNFDLVLSGHIHAPQMVSHKCFMMGSPIHQDRGDVGTKMGYLLIYENDLQFVPLNDIFPQYIQLTQGENPYNDKDYFLPYIEPYQELDTPNGPTLNTSTLPKMVKSYFKIQNIKNKRQRNLAIKLLNQSITV